MKWIKSINDFIEKTFEKARQPLSYLPSILLLCEVATRPGLSAIGLAAAIIKRLPEAGIHIGVNPDGSPNKVTQFVSILSQEFVNELHNNAVVEGALQPGSIISLGTGGNAGGPVVIQSTNTFPSSLRALIR